MKNVRKTIVTVAAMIVSTLFVIAIATPRTRRIVRVRRSTTRSGVTRQGSRLGRTTPSLRWLPVRFSERRGWTSAAVLAGYVLVAFVYWGVRLLPHPGRFLLGSGS